MVTAVVRVTILASFLSHLALAFRCPISLALALAFAYVHSRMSRWAGSSAGFAFKYSCFYQHSASSLSDAPRPVPMSTKLSLFSPLVPKSFLQLVFPCIWAFHLSSPSLCVSDADNKTGNSVDCSVCSSLASTSCSNASAVMNRLWFDVQLCLMSAGAILFRCSDFRVPSLSGSPGLVVYSRAFSLQSLILLLGRKCGVELRIRELVQQVGVVSHCLTSKEGLPLLPFSAHRGA